VGVLSVNKGLDKSYSEAKLISVGTEPPSYCVSEASVKITDSNGDKISTVDVYEDNDGGVVNVLGEAKDLHNIPYFELFYTKKIPGEKEKTGSLVFKGCPNDSSCSAYFANFKITDAPIGTIYDFKVEASINSDITNECNNPAVKSLTTVKGCPLLSCSANEYTKPINSSACIVQKKVCSTANNKPSNNKNSNASSRATTQENSCAIVSCDCEGGYWWDGGQCVANPTVSITADKAESIVVYPSSLFSIETNSEYVKSCSSINYGSTVPYEYEYEDGTKEILYYTETNTEISLICIGNDNKTITDTATITVKEEDDGAKADVDIKFYPTSGSGSPDGPVTVGYNNSGGQLSWESNGEPCNITVYSYATNNDLADIIRNQTRIGRPKLLTVGGRELERSEYVPPSGFMILYSHKTTVQYGISCHKRTHPISHARDFVAVFVSDPPSPSVDLKIIYNGDKEEGKPEAILVSPDPLFPETSKVDIEFEANNVRTCDIYSKTDNDSKLIQSYNSEPDYAINKTKTGLTVKKPTSYSISCLGLDGSFVNDFGDVTIQGFPSAIIEIIQNGATVDKTWTEVTSSSEYITIEWECEDADINGCTLRRINPDGSAVELSKEHAGILDFSEFGDGGTTFEITASNINGKKTDNRKVYYIDPVNVVPSGASQALISKGEVTAWKDFVSAITLNSGQTLEITNSKTNPIATIISEGNARKVKKVTSTFKCAPGELICNIDILFDKLTKTGVYNYITTIKNSTNKVIDINNIKIIKTDTTSNKAISDISKATDRDLTLSEARDAMFYSSIRGNRYNNWLGALDKYSSNLSARVNLKNYLIK